MFKPETAEDHLAVKQLDKLYREVERTMDTERSRQQQIGVSEIGNDCDKCVARKLAMLEPKESSPSWRAQVGTFIHAGLEQHFEDISDAAALDPARKVTNEDPAYVAEMRLKIWEYKGFTLSGSCDLFVKGSTFGLVCDWKTQGAAKLKATASGKIPPYYIVQMHTYGLGYEQLGFTPTHVTLFALPRDGDLFESKPVLWRWDRQIAIDALARLKRLIDAAEIVGWPMVIDAQDSASSCYDCKRFHETSDRDVLAGLTD